MLAATIAVQLVVLYAPRAPGTGGLPWDKLVHALVFGAVLWAGLRCGIRTGPLVAVLVAHAVISEVLQATALPHRSGDPLDVIADVTGVLLALVLAKIPRFSPAA